MGTGQSMRQSEHSQRLSVKLALWVQFMAPQKLHS